MRKLRLTEVKRLAQDGEQKPTATNTEPALGSIASAGTGQSRQVGGKAFSAVQMA